MNILVNVHFLSKSYVYGHECTVNMKLQTRDSYLSLHEDRKQEKTVSLTLSEGNIIHLPAPLKLSYKLSYLLNSYKSVKTTSCD